MYRIFMNIRYIFDRWGSCAALARDLNCRAGNVRAWKRRNQIPGKYWRAIAIAAAEHGYTDISVVTLSEAHQPQIKNCGSEFTNFGSPRATPDSSRDRTNDRHQTSACHVAAEDAVDEQTPITAD